MRISARYAIAPIILLLAAALTGCQEQTATDTRKARLVVDENLRLKNQIADLQRQIADLNAKNENALAEKDAQIQACIEEKTQLQTQLGGVFEEQFLGILRDCLAEQATLQAENEELRSQLELSADPNS